MHFNTYKKPFDTEIVQPEDDNALLIPLQYEFLHQVIRCNQLTLTFLLRYANFKRFLNNRIRMYHGTDSAFPF